MGQIELEYKIHAPLSKVWRSLIDPKIIESWGGGPAKMSDKEGFKFSLWGGEIYGTNTKVVKETLLEQDWYSESSWAKPSKLTFKLHEVNGLTVLALIHDDIPDNEVEDIDQGWKKFYLGPLKELLEDSSYQT
jgi:uncharacterized protein YndB with AHSA1/START domain